MRSDIRWVLAFALVISIALAGPIAGIGAADQSPPYDGCLFIWTYDENGDEEITTLYVQAENSDYSELKETTDEDECDSLGSSNGVSFDAADDDDHIIRMYDSSADYSWGVFETFVDRSDENFEYLERGGVYSTDGDISPTDDLYEPNGQADINVNLYNGQEQSGASGIVEVYVYPEGEERPNNPDEVLQTSSLNSGESTSVSGRVDLPFDSGTYKVKTIIRTEYDILSWETPTDRRHVGTIDVVDPSPPEIDSLSPSDSFVQLSPDESTPFTASVSHNILHDSDIDTQWYINNEHETDDRDFTFDADRFGPGTHEVDLYVQDGLDGTNDLMESWEIKVISGPEIDSIQIPTSTIDAGEELELSAQASDEQDSSSELTYTWRVDGEEYSGSTVIVSPTEVGESEITLSVENTAGIETTSTSTVTVTNTPPSIDTNIPETVETQEQTTFSAMISNSDDSTVNIELVIDGTTVDTVTATGSTDTIDFAHEFSEPRKATVLIKATDDHGATESVSRNVEVSGQAPKIQTHKPTSSRLDVSSGETLDFEVDAADPDGQEVTINWFRDGSQIDSGTSSTSVSFDQSGEYDIKAEVTDASGDKTTQSWTVTADSFRVSPSLGNHSTTTSIETDGTAEFLTFSIQNPEANDRDLNVEIVADLPSGIQLEGMSGLETADQAQSVAIAEIEPGDRTHAGLEIGISDESLAGDTISIDSTIRYYPDENPDDVVEIFDEQITIEIADAEDGESTAGQSTPSEDRNGTDDDVPGFGVSTLLVALTSLLSLQVLRHRFNND